MNQIAAAMILATVITAGCDSSSSPPNTQPQTSGRTAKAGAESAEAPAGNYNAIAFRKARNGAAAAMAYNWSTANAILDSIDVGQIDDTDTIAYVDYCKRCARVAQDIGVSNKSNPNSIADTAANLDLAQLAATAWTTVESKGWSGAVQLAADAKRVRDEIPMWQKLDAILTSRYGIE